MCNLILHFCAHTAQALWLCWEVCACSTKNCYLLCCVMVGMRLAAASWQSKNGLLVTLPLSRFPPAPLTVVACCGTAVMFDGRDALASCQPAGSLLSLQSANFDKDALRGGSCAGVGHFVPDPVPYPFQTRTNPVPRLTHSRVNKWQVLT